MSNVKGELMSLANNFGFQFPNQVIEHIQKEFFGDPNSARSTDTIIVNSTYFTLRLTSLSCETGEWCSSALPLHEILPQQISYHRSESHGVFTGCTNCRVEYQADGIPNSRIWLSTSNPYAGDNHAHADGGDYFNVSVDCRSGDNNLVKFTITSK